MDNVVFVSCVVGIIVAVLIRLITIKQMQKLNKKGLNAIFKHMASLQRIELHNEKTGKTTGFVIDHLLNTSKANENYLRETNKSVVNALVERKKTIKEKTERIKALESMNEKLRTEVFQLRGGKHTVTINPPSNEAVLERLKKAEEVLNRTGHKLEDEAVLKTYEEVAKMNWEIVA